MVKEQKIRGILYYISVLVFLAGLPAILSFALGYKFNPRTLKFTKTGLIIIKTNPEGASIHMEKRRLSEKTPFTIHELLPGTYSITLELENHYPWFGKVPVQAGKVTRLDKIILFPQRPDIKQLNKEAVSSFRIDKDAGLIYYLGQSDSLLYVSDIEGGDFKRLGALPRMRTPAKDWKISSDRTKALCFNIYEIAIVFLDGQEERGIRQPSFVLDYSGRRIMDAFWHADNYHLIVVTDRSIEAHEARLDSLPVVLVNLNKRNAPAFYDPDSNTLYFADLERAPDGGIYDNVYKLDLGTKFGLLQDLLGPKRDE